MLRRWAFVVAAGAALAATPAAAQITTLARSGVWRAYGGIADDGKRVCGVIEDGADGRTFSLKYFEGAENFEVLIGKDSWSIPAGTRINVSISFDAAAPWSGNATGNGKIMFLSVPFSRMPAFVREFKAADNMRIFFPSGSEAPWRGSLAGSTAIMSSMVACMGDMASSPGGPAPFREATQPYNAPSQPFSGPAPNANPFNGTTSNGGKRRAPPNPDGSDGGLKD